MSRRVVSAYFMLITSTTVLPGTRRWAARGGLMTGGEAAEVPSPDRSTSFLQTQER